MNILILNTNNPYKDAGVVALDLLNDLKSRGHEVRLLVKRYFRDYPEDIISLKTSFTVYWETLWANFIYRAGKIIGLNTIAEDHSRDANYSFFQLDETKRFYSTRKILRKAKFNPEVIIILYAKNFLNLRNIYELAKITGAKIFWLMYDMAPFTGGCHYAWDCKGYQNSCGSCPALFSSNPKDISFKNLRYKQKYLSKTNVQFIAGSEWQFNQARKSSLLKDRKLHKLLISVDPDVFKPFNKNNLRIEKNISLSRKIVFFGSVGLNEKRKGMRYLLESLKQLRVLIENQKQNFEKGILLLVAGSDFERIHDLMPFEYLYLGYLKTSSELAAAYQMADVFVCPSVEDSGPTMINQSIMCGTPVVAFEMGVSYDLVITGKTGYRAKILDINDMAKGIYSILSLNPIDYENLSSNCRKLALELFSPDARLVKLEYLMQNS